MARTAQTAGLGRAIYHIQRFVDHAGQPATRVRHSRRNEPIPTDFHAQPVFTFQIYTTFPVEFDERPAKRVHDIFDAERTILTDLIDYVGSLDVQRPDPIWELYVEQQCPLDCVEHQRREIAHRKARREYTSIPPIPKVVRNWAYDHDGKTGFIIVVDSDSFKAGMNGTPGPLWVHFDRKFPSKISWEPRLRLDDPDIPDDNPEDVNSDIPTNDMLWSPRAQRILPERVEARFLRIQLVGEMRYDLGYMCFFSCATEDPPSPVQDTMDICWDEDEGTPDDEREMYTQDIITTLQNAAGRLSLDVFNIQKSAETETIISNVAVISDPDLRYVIYVPFLHQFGMDNKLEQVATAFTYEITSRLSGKKTVSFEFCKPPSNTLTSALTAYRARSGPEDYIGAVTTFPNESCDNDKEDSVFVRAHPIARGEQALENDPALGRFEPYRTFLVVLDRPDFSQIRGGVLFLLADGGKGRPDADANQDRPPRMKVENQDYTEMELWRCAGMDEVARRLQMIWGGEEWEEGKEDQAKPEQ